MVFMQTAEPHSSSAVSDQQAIGEVVRGNREMFEPLVRRYNQLLYRVGMSYLHKHELVEDAMQNTYLKAFLNLARFKQDAAFPTWLSRIMINECLMQLRRNKATREELGKNDIVAGLPDDGARPGTTSLNLKEMKTLLEKAISELPRRYRCVYVLREVQQLSTDETAATLGLSPENVKVTLHRARERLKFLLLQSAAGVELFPYHAPYCNRLTAQVMSAVLAVS